MFSVSATFAVDEDVALNTSNDEITIDNDVLSVDDETNVLEIENTETLETDVSSEIVSESATVTNDTFFNYFDSNGTLKSDVTNDELIFEGEFSKIPNIANITINKTIKLTGKEAILNNMSLIIKADNIVIDSFVINTDNAHNAISIEPTSNVKLLNNNITFNAAGNDGTACAVYADVANLLTLQNNRVTVVGNKSGNKVLNFVDCVDAVVDNNTFIATIPSSGYMVGVLHFDIGTDNLEFTNNTVNVTSTSSADTINAIVFYGNNVTIDDNDISATNDKYSYAIYAGGEDSKVINNVIKAQSPNYACGIDLEGFGTLLVDNNEFIIISDNAAYGIYSGMTSGGLTGIYSNNNISVEGYFAVGIELCCNNETAVGNTINAEGNYTIGVAAGYCNAYDADWNPIQIPIENRLIKNNTIVSKGSNNGTNATGDSYFKKLESVGISAVIGNITIYDNKINTTGDYAINLGGNNNIVYDNNLSSAKGEGDKAINGSYSGPVIPTPTPTPTPVPTPVKVTKKAIKITAKKKTFKVKTKVKKYTIVLKSGKKAVKGLKVTLKIKGKTYKATTNAKGKATFKIKNLKKKGTFTAKIKFAGSNLYKAASKSVKIKVKK